MKTAFYERVYEIARHIPTGKVVTYGQLAKMAGHPGAARAVGMCMRSNNDIPKTPCHRVVGHDGSLVGYAGTGGLEGKRALLVAEGVVFRNKKVDLKASQWKPNDLP